MNWRAGLFRLWVVFSCAWCAYWLWHYDSACSPQDFDGAYYFCGEPPLLSPSDFYTMIAETLVAGPIVGGLIGLGALWAMNGFRRPSSN